MMKRVLKWIGAAFVFSFIVLLVGRGIYRVFDSRTEAQVVRIHDTKLKIGDVMGENLPPVPSDPDSSIQGVDANENGIRDDVELAIFKEYPNSAKTRAVLLQYALALQMEVVQPIVNEGTVTAVAQDSGRAHLCVGEITSRSDMNKFIETTKGFYSFIEDRQWNLEARRKAHKDFYDGNLSSYSSPEEICDLDVTLLIN